MSTDRNRCASTTPIGRVVDFFETLSPSSLHRIGDIYAVDARFTDPFNEVQGTSAIARVFEHMFATTEAPRFAVMDTLGDDAQGFVTWTFHFRSVGFGARDWTIRGASHLAFDQHGRIHVHRDYWDAAQEFYERWPLLGALLRAIKRRIRA